MLLSGWLHPSIYWTYVFIIVTILLVREMLGPLQDQRALKWKRRLKFVAAPMVLLFIFYLTVQLINIVVKAFA